MAACSGTISGGLDTGAGLALDGKGNVWVANEVTKPSSGVLGSGGISEFTSTTSGTSTTIAELSPAGSSTPVCGFGSAIGYSGPIQPVIDSPGNVQVATCGGTTLN